MGRVHEIGAELLVMALIGLVAGLLGPFGTFAMPVPIRIAVWLLFALGGYACFRPVMGAGRLLAARAGLPQLLALALACAIASLPVTLLVGWVFGRGERASLVETYPYVVLMGGLATGIQFALFRRRGPVVVPVMVPMSAAPPAPITTAPAQPAPGPQPVASSPAFLDRLPPNLGRDLLCLEMEDHYVRAHTDLGSTLILMRMRDAVAELAGVEGERVHRSWWVARAAVREAVMRDRATVLRLRSGLDVPVARNSVPLLRAKGWL